MTVIFDPNCRRCPRLAQFLLQVKAKHPSYHCRPVPSFGDEDPSALIVGLGPGMHGANRTGRPFTGDFAGILLYATLHRYAFASSAQSTSAQDALVLRGVRIANAVKCLPPDNKPLPVEIANCNEYLRAELQVLTNVRVILALGLVAHAAVLKSLRIKLSTHRFGHGAEHRLPDGRTLIDSYHCSRYNTQTRRLTTGMFEAVVKRVRDLS